MNTQDEICLQAQVAKLVRPLVDERLLWTADLLTDGRFFVRVSVSHLDCNVERKVRNALAGTGYRVLIVKTDRPDGLVWDVSPYEGRSDLG